jgi:predicted small secreted protein
MRVAMVGRILAGCLMLVMLAGTAALLSACNTVHGLGEDIQKSSDTVKKAL